MYRSLTLVLNEIKTYYFIDKIYSESVILFESIEESKAQQKSPKGISKRPNELNAKQSSITCIDHSFINIKQSKCNDAPEATCAIHFGDIKRVVDFIPYYNFARLVVNDRAYDTNYGCAPEFDVVAGCSYAYKAS